MVISIVPRTQLLEFRFTDTDPQFAARAVQSYIDAYLENNFKAKFQSIAQTTDWLTKQLADLQMKVEISQEKLVRYQREHNIIGVDEKTNITTTRLDELNRELSQAQNDRIRTEANYRSAARGDVELIAKSGLGDLLPRLRSEESDLKSKLAQASVRYGPSFPKVLELKSELSQVQSSIAEEQRKLLGKLQGEFQVSSQRERMLRSAMGKQTQEANLLNESAIQYNLLKRDVDTNRQLYEGLLQRLKEASVIAGLKSSNVTVIDPARVPTRPSEPNIPRNLFLGLMVGLLGGVGLAIVLELLDTTVNTPDDVQMATGLPVVGVVPSKCQDSEPKTKHGFTTLSTNAGPVRFPLLAYERPRSQIAEAYRALRTSILLSCAPPKVIVVTSSLPQEGKTTTSTNIAIVLAQKGARVLLIDADLRRPRIHKMMGATQRSGLTTLLRGQHSENDVIALTKIANLFCLYAGPTPPQPSEMLSSPQMRRYMAKWRNEFDHIVIDTPPILAVTDAALLSVDADAVLMVIRSGQTTKEALRRAHEVLAQVKAPMTGVVVNGVDTRQSHYYYYGTKYGGSYFDEQY